MTPNDVVSSIKVEWLRDHMSYDPETGAFSWKLRAAGRTVGKLLGRSNGGYSQIKVNGKLYYAHRLAWFYVHGVWPSHQIDHIDGNKANNAIANLREATAAQNSARRKVRADISPSRGIFPHGPGFVARIHHRGVRHYLGYFSNLEDAKSAYETKAKEIHGEFRHVAPQITIKMPDGASSGLLSFGA